MKHVVERAMGTYVTNGELIAAALVVAYPFKYTAGPNPLATTLPNGFWSY